MFPGMPRQGMPKPGQGLDPMAAMMGQGGPSPMGPPMPGPPPPPFPAGPNGLPPGGSMPDMDAANDVSSSPLMAALMAELGGGSPDMMGGHPGDPYSLPPGGPGQVFDDGGTGDPQMGLSELLQLLAMSQAGVGGPGQGPGMGIGPPPGQGMGY